VNADTLRQTLRSRAGQAPTSVGLLDAVRVRSRRRRRRRLLGNGVVVVAITAALAMAGSSLLSRPDAAPAPPASAVPGPSPSAPGPTSLGPARPFDLPAFPFTPGWTPPGVSEAFYRYEVALGRIELNHYDPRRGYIAFWVTTLSKDPKGSLDKLIPGGRQDTVSVRGQRALAVSNGQVAAVGWRHRPGLWVMVHGTTVDAVVRYADALVENPFPTGTPFTFDLMPRWATLAWTAGDEMMLGAPDGGDGIEVKLRRGGPGLTVACSIGTGPGSYRSACPLPRTPVRAGAHQGEMVGDSMILVYLEDGLALQVTVAGSPSFSRDDLVRFAGGIRVTPHAYPTS